jgi:hypothetical protein
MTVQQTPTDYDTDVQTATAALRDLLANRIHAEDCGCKSAVHPAEQWEYYGRLSDAMLSLFTADWDHGVRYNPAKDDVHLCDDADHAAEWKRDLGWEGPIVRRLNARLAGMPWNPTDAGQQNTADSRPKESTTTASDDLRKHLLSAHCNLVALDLTHEEAADEHGYEHIGPGTIRNHDLGDLSWDQATIDARLAEAAVEM